MARAASATAQWYRHGWNNTTSLRLILTIVPRLPRWLVPPVAFVTTAICMSRMKREREAAARNLRRILGRGGLPLWITRWKLFYNFSRFMSSYCDLLRWGPEELFRRVEASGTMQDWIERSLAGGRGAVVLTAHLGNWEVGARLLERSGRPINVVMHAERGNAAERWLMRLRKKGVVRVIRAGTNISGTLEVLDALARNEIVAMQGDRAFGGRTIEVELFGSRFSFPMGPFLVAYLGEAPLLAAFVIQRGWSRWRVELIPPIDLQRSGDRDADLRAGVEAYARELEKVVRRHPDQWFNFFDLWPPEPQPAEPGAAV